MAYFTTSDGVRIHYEEQGEGPALVMVHGWTANMSFFDRQVDALSEKYRIIRLDLRGHGASERDEATERGMSLQTLGRDLSELLDELKLEKASLLGWSMGVMVIWDYIRQFGCARIDKLFLVDMTPKNIVSEDWPFGLNGNETFESSEGFGAFAASDWPTAASLFVPNMFEGAQAKDPELLNWAIAQAQDNIPHNMVFLMLSMSVNDYRDVLPTIDVPTLLLYGKDSVMYGEAVGKRVNEMIPDSKLVVLPGGHIMQMEYPEEFNKAVLDF